MTDRKNLVIVRAGKKSLHKHWLNETSARNWDLFVSLYDDDPYVPLCDEEFALIKGGKWDGIHKTIEMRPEILAKYDYFWLPDDDILTDQETINKIFEMMRLSKLRVAQPSLTWDSYFTHYITLNTPGLSIRYTNFVEIMVPCLDADLLKTCLPLFKDTMTGFGLDWIWPRIDPNPSFKAGIFDAITVKHTRPIGVFFI